MLAIPAEAGWTELTTPTTYHLNGLFFVDDLTGYTVGQAGVVLKTTNGGTSWHDQSIGGSGLADIHILPTGPSYENLLTYTEIDPRTNITTSRYTTAIHGDSEVDQNTYLYYQYPDDSGAAGLFDDDIGYEHLFEFVVSTNDPSDNWVCPWVVSNEVVPYDNLVSGYSFCLFEANSGKINIEIYNNNTTDVDSASVPGIQVGKTIYARAEILPGSTASIYLYSDAARTTLINGPGFTNPIEVAASTNLSYHYLYAIETDVRGTWMQDLVISNIDIQRDTGYIAGEGGDVPRTTSGGAGLPTGWNPDTAKAGAAFQAIHFLDPDIGWVTGEDGNILQTTNGGGSWNQQYANAADSFKDIYIVNSNNGWVVGKNGLIRYYNGANWSTIQATPTTENLHGVFFSDSSNGWVVGKNGVILHTVNGGSSWLQQSTPTSAELNGVFFTDSSNGWAVGANSIIFYTADGGANWVQQTAPVAGIKFNRVHFPSGTTGYIVGENGTILKTTDGGGAIIPGPQLFKKVFLTDGYPVADGATLPQGTLVQFLIYINNTGSAQNDVSVQDILDPTFLYQGTSLKVDNSQTACVTSPCSEAEETAIYTAVKATAALSDTVSLADVASFTNGDTINTGNANVGNAQLDISGSAVWALLLTTQLQ